jgi:L-ascorbate metabolism protein UlaG (beta-lactamase superfamily)
MYNVGFGDCFLLTFPYADADRHVLVDFGSTRLPKAAPKGWMTRIAKDIQKECGNKPLDAIVVSHRHKDHLNGFSGEPAEVIDALDPQLVVQPWTEDPKARHDAREARLVQGLHEAQTLVAHVIAARACARRATSASTAS